LGDFVVAIHAGLRTIARDEITNVIESGRQLSETAAFFVLGHIYHGAGLLMGR